MQSMTSYRRRRYIVEKHKIPTRRHKRTSNVKKFPFPVTRTCSPIAHRRPNGSSASATSCRKKTRLGKQKRFSSAPRRPLFGRRRRRSPWQGGDAGVNRPCPPAEKVLKRSLLEDFSLLYRLFTGLRAASAAAVHRQRYRRAVVGGIRVGRTARDPTRCSGTAHSRRRSAYPQAAARPPLPAPDRRR